VTPEKARQQERLARALGWRPVDEPARDEPGRFTTAVVPFDAGARRSPPPRRDPLAEHAATLVGLIRARRYGLRDPEW